MKKTLWILGLLLLLLGAMSYQKPSTMTLPAQPTAVSFTALPSGGLVYHFSITPGGVHSAREAGLQHGHAQVLTQDKWAFVSYMRHGQVFWTKHPVLLRAGETIYVDGDKIVRGRCGNGVAFFPKAPTESEDISAQLDLLEVPALPAPEVPAMGGARISAPGYLVPPVSGGDYPPILVGPFPITNAPIYLPGGGVSIAPVAVPEPAECTFILMAVFGLADSIARKYRKGRS